MDSADTRDTMIPGRENRSTLAPNTTLGQYRVIKLLGRGGMGEVYLVEHAILTTRHALKLLPGERSRDAAFVRRFHDEARVMAKLTHPGIVHVTHADETPATDSVPEGRHYLVMDFIGADDSDTPFDIEDALSEAPEGRLPPETVARLCMQICEAVASAHGHSVVHRDLKPANVLLTNRDLSHAEVRVADFGLARLLGEDWVRSRVDTSIRRSLSMGDAQTMAQPRAQRSSTGAILGTYEYMSPEQREGLEVDIRSDVFSMGVMLYRMITGKRLVGRAKAASRLVGGLEKGWDDLIDACLEENPADRPRDMATVGNRLNGLLASEGQRGREEEEAAARRGAAAMETRRREKERRDHEAQERRAKEEQVRREEQARQAEAQERARMEAEKRAAQPGRKTSKGKKGLLVLVCLLAVFVCLPIGYALWQHGIIAPRVQKSRSSPRTLPASSGSVISRPVASRAGTQRGPMTGKPWTSPSSGMEFVWIDALKIWVGKYEATNGEYRKKVPGHDSKDYEGNSLNGDRQPVVYINFDDAKAYAEWLTERDRAAGRLPAGYRYRLPSEQEWMTFAQCGRGWEYPWGNDWPPRSGQAGNYDDETTFDRPRVAGGYSDGHPVTCRVEDSWANPWNLYGVGGNVWECCAKDDSGASFGAWRGASWYRFNQGGLRCSYRVVGSGSARNGSGGFRLVLSR